MRCEILKCDKCGAEIKDGDAYVAISFRRSVNRASALSQHLAAISDRRDGYLHTTTSLEMCAACASIVQAAASRG